MPNLRQYVPAVVLSLFVAAVHDLAGDVPALIALAVFVGRLYYDVHHADRGNA